MSHSPIRSKAGIQAISRVRKLCDRFPEYTVAEDKFGHTSFRVRNKPFVMMGEGDGSLGMAIKVEHATQLRLIRDSGFTRTMYIGQHGWASCELGAKTDWVLIERLVEEAYRRTAPKSVLKRWDASGDRS